MTTPPEDIIFTGRIGEVINTPKPDGRVFERYRRAPGTRLVIVSADNKILFSREYRHESDAVDLRLPGGKVRDSIQEFHELLKNGQDMTEAARDACAIEARQEAGLVIHDPKLIVKANAGATVEWDLYYFLVRHYEAHQDGRELSENEDVDIKGAVWLTPTEVRAAIANGQMQEWRSVGVLLGLVLPKLEG